MNTQKRLEELRYSQQEMEKRLLNLELSGPSMDNQYRAIAQVKEEIERLEQA